MTSDGGVDKRIKEQRWRGREEKDKPDLKFSKVVLPLTTNFTSSTASGLHTKQNHNLKVEMTSTS